MKNIYISILLLLSLSQTLFAQSEWSFAKEIKFYKHLNSQKLYKDAETHLLQLSQKNRFTASQSDSIQFYLGYLYYETQKTKKAISPFSLLQNPNHPLFEKAHFTEAFVRSYNGDFFESDSVLLSLNPQKEVLQELKTFQLAVNSLLARDYSRFDSLENKLTGKFYSFKKPLDNLIIARADLGNFKKKSTFLAGGMSTIIPGSGKMYAGKLGEGIASLLQCTFLGLQTLEAWNKKPTLKNNPRLWAYGGLFSVFYVGNIWGSVLSVHIRRKEFYDTIDNSIYVDMHIPLRTIFR